MTCERNVYAIETWTIGRRCEKQGAARGLFMDIHAESGPERPWLELGDGVPFAIDPPGGVPPAW